MRKILLAIGATLVIASAQSFAPNRASALTLPAAAGLQAAIQETSPVQTATYRYRHWGYNHYYWAPRYRYYHRPYGYYAPYSYYNRPYYRHYRYW